ncbi:MAG: RING finger protein [Amphiamblys sp. WSBS2006]|nr:MAG: RING finger protein [Amphiamblys sp. WSBS2006]
MLDDTQEKKGLTFAEIRRLGSFMFTRRNIKRRSPQNKSCSICFTDFEEKERVTVLHCKHTYHTECLRPWLKKNKTCPLCRISLK